jgi:hypothetical protein
MSAEVPMADEYIDVVLYSIWGNKFKILYGTISELKIREPDTAFRNDGCFYTTSLFSSTDNMRIRRFTVSAAPGVVYNRMVWFKSENEKRAKELLLKNEFRLIKELDDKIVSHRECIKLLEAYERRQL